MTTRFWLVVMVLGIVGCTNDTKDDDIQEEMVQQTEKIDVSSTPPFRLEVVDPTFEQMATTNIVGQCLDKAGGVNLFDLRDVSWTIRNTVIRVVSNDPTKIDERMYCALMQSPSHAENYGVAYQPELWDWRAKMLETARVELKDPDRLWSTYTQFRPIIMAWLGTQGNEKPSFREYLETEVIPVFAGLADMELDDKVQKMHEFRAYYSAAYDEEKRLEKLCPWGSATGTGYDVVYHYKDGVNCTEEIRNQMIQMNGDSFYIYESFRGLQVELETNPLYYEYEWMLRRRAEGGQPLVDAWLRIFEDLSNLCTSN